MGIMKQMVVGRKLETVQQQRPAPREIPSHVRPCLISAPSTTPAPCPVCRSPFFWLDVYGGGPHCCDCRPAPARPLVRPPLWGIAGPPGGPWWWETLAEQPEDRLVFGVSGGGGGCGCGSAGGSAGGSRDTITGGVDALQVVEYAYHGRELLTVVGSGSIAGERGPDAAWRKCVVWCWRDLEPVDLVAAKDVLHDA